MTIPTPKNEPYRRQVRHSVTEFKGMDTGNTDSTIFKGFGRRRENVEVVGGKLKALPPCAINSHATYPSTPRKKTYSTLWVNGKQYGFMGLGANPNDILWWEIGGNSTGTVYSVSTGVAGTHLVQGKDKIYIEGGSPSIQVIEWSATNARFERRDMGLLSPRILSTSSVAGPGGIIGTYQYGVELVVMEGSVVVRSSGISRLTTAGDKIGYTTLSAIGTASVLVQDPSTAVFTHIRLWRSKRLDLDTTSGTGIAGTDSALYCVKVLTKAVWDAAVVAHGGGSAEITDSTYDSNLPKGSTGEYLPTTPEVLDLLAFSSVKHIGLVSSTALFGGGVPDDEQGVYASAGRYAARYEEQYSPADRIGDAASGKILGLYRLVEDLIIRTEKKLWRLPQADIDAKMIELCDAPTAFSAESVCVVKDLGLFIIDTLLNIHMLDTDFVWHLEIPGKIGPASRNILKGATSVQTECAGGRLCIWGDGIDRFLVLDPANGFFRWGRVGYDPEVVWNGSWGYPAFVTGTDQISLGNPSGTSKILEPRISVGPFQSEEMGYGLTELQSVRIEGIDAFVTACTLSDFSDDVRDMDTKGIPFNDRGVASRVYYLSDRGSLPLGLVGQRIFVDASFVLTKGEEIDGFFVDTLVQKDGLTDEWFTNTVDDSALQADFLSGMVLRFTRTDPLNDYFENGPLTET